MVSVALSVIGPKPDGRFNPFFFKYGVVAPNPGTTSVRAETGLFFSKAANPGTWATGRFGAGSKLIGEKEGSMGSSSGRDSCLGAGSAAPGAGC
jgi:hypothetical protein